MKRKVAILASVVALAAGACVAGQVWAQQGSTSQASYSPQVPPLQSKIALVNIAQVIKSYKKYQNLDSTIKAEGQGINRDLENKRTQALGLQKELEKPDVQPANKDQIEREVKRLQREMQDTLDEAKQRFKKQEFESMAIIYKEVAEAVERYAHAYAIELVMQYSDGTDSERFLPQALQQKLINNACFPLYIDPRMNITDPVIQMLNQKYAAAGSTTPH